jgi:hypothetical protein
LKKSKGAQVAPLLFFYAEGIKVLISRDTLKKHSGQEEARKPAALESGNLSGA